MRLALVLRLLGLVLIVRAANAQAQSSLTGPQNSPEADQTTAAFDLPRSATSVPFRLVDGRIFVDIKVNKVGPFAFLFDTGGNAVISAEAAERMHL
ncbi:MAG: hypothetical protein ABSG69_15650, partial [Candidatus Acidiferrum sp.]